MALIEHTYANSNTPPPVFQNALVLPAYREFERADVYKKAIDGYQNLDSRIPGLGVVVFADGCEKSAEIAETMGALVMRHEDGQNHGRGESLREAFRRLSAANQATHEVDTDELDEAIYGYADADGAYSPTHIVNLFEAIRNGNQLAVSHRLKDEGTSLIRKVAHPIMYQVCERIAPTNIKDPQAGAKAFSQTFIDEVILETQTDRWAFDRELAAIANRDDRPTADIGTDITVLDDFSTVRPIHDTMQMIEDSFRIRNLHLK